jgi:outer membrane protein assembly factor BamD (BamD/ComL family)
MPRHSLQRAVPLALSAALLAAVGAASGAQPAYELGEEGWAKLEAAEPGPPATALQRVRRLLAEGNPRKAMKAASDWLRRHPDHERRPEALLLRGDAKVARERYYESLSDYEAIAQKHPESAPFHKALERELEIAKRFSRGLRRLFLGLRLLPAESEAEEIFIRIQERAPGSNLGERASRELADHYHRQGEMANAVEAYELLLENYPESRFKTHAMLRLVQASLGRFSGPAFDATGLLDAREYLRQFRAQYPAQAKQFGATAIGVRIEESLAQKALKEARWLEKRDERVSARYV